MAPQPKDPSPSSLADSLTPSLHHLLSLGTPGPLDSLTDLQQLLPHLISKKQIPSPPFPAEDPHRSWLSWDTSRSPPQPHHLAPGHPPAGLSRCCVSALPSPTHHPPPTLGWSSVPSALLYLSWAICDSFFYYVKKNSSEETDKTKGMNLIQRRDK